ncbi:MAG: DNA-directed RNA polymerase specialized sigma subunit, sigma24-like [uncultured Corynebacteriales bacterium]|uniref:DNA-directed RNA polymerase specialized sigma subunit, sigma24-like n=1 Tax=uncultured Mycobacteriales bacterium TaxID=581187 RepID=A0A6J4HMM8_9ACTN|nr:MAG: DNA-directed RNA polymerase specialized sigma subunit, sigma24-like [uncultured Corynebacteriales bacterium]
MRDEAGFTDFVHDRSTALLRTAVLLVGGDRGHAEDLLQGVLERMYVRWARIEGPPEAYARRALAHAAVNRWRSRRRRPPEQPLRDPDPGGAAPGDGAATVDLRDALVRALLTLPPRQRAVLVLRYLDDLPEDEVARALGCSVGTVKSQASRGLSRLRDRSAHLEISTGGTR